ncbi:MAG: HU family DNA-binding protein [Proteobacteria bacterium]|nr:HU family DNA-binding protein [Pseudomonadota bacterium]
MKRTELVAELAKKTDSSKTQSEKFLSAFIETVFENIASKDGVRLVGFGTFKTADRSARTARNPQTGEEIKIPARKVPVFRASNNLKEACKKKKKK